MNSGNTPDSEIRQLLDAAPVTAELLCSTEQRTLVPEGGLQAFTAGIIPHQLALHDHDGDGLMQDDDHQVVLRQHRSTTECQSGGMTVGRRRRWACDTTQHGHA